MPELQSDKEKAETKTERIRKRESDKNVEQIKRVDLNENRDNVTDLQCTVS